MATIVSIVSKETIPNILFIKQYTKENDHFLFISSKEMEDKKVSQNIINACGIAEGKYNIEKIDPENVTKIHIELTAMNLDSEEQYLVNITGGNKMMSQMVYTYFYTLPNVIIYYIPIGSDNIQILHPELNEEKLVSKISLKEYFTGFGYEIETGVSFKQYPISTSQLFKGVIDNNGACNVSYITQAADNEYKLDDKGYLMGAWFEEFLYNKIKSELFLKDVEIAFNVKIKNITSQTKTNSNNEIDIAYVYKNTLHIVECKVYSTFNNKAIKFTDPIYKTSAIANSLGFACKSYVAILGEIPKDETAENQISDLQSLLRITKVFTFEDFKHLGDKVMGVLKK